MDCMFSPCGCMDLSKPHGPWWIVQALGLGTRVHWAGPAHACMGPVRALGHACLCICVFTKPSRCQPAATSCIVPSSLIFFRVYLHHLDSVWAILGLVRLRSSSWTSQWAQYRSNLEASNLNTCMPFYVQDLI